MSIRIKLFITNINIINIKKTKKTWVILNTITISKKVILLKNI